MPFEAAVEQHILAPRYGWPLIPLERHRCTMAWRWRMDCRRGLTLRRMHSSSANRKDAAGERLMHQMSKPRRPHKDEDPAGYIGLTIQNGSIGSMIIAARTSRSSANSINDCRRCRRRTGSYGS